MLKLFKTGVVRGSTHTAQGQEAVTVGMAAATVPSDWVVITYRSHHREHRGHVLLSTWVDMGREAEVTVKGVGGWTGRLRGWLRVSCVRPVGATARYL
ncbi:MAG: thiamine pyrophosphate-dependent enzyme [Acidimicrobiia bacterium]